MCMGIREKSKTSEAWVGVGLAGVDLGVVGQEWRSMRHFAQRLIGTSTVPIQAL